MIGQSRPGHSGAHVRTPIERGVRSRPEFRFTVQQAREKVAL